MKGKISFSIALFAVAALRLWFVAELPLGQTVKYHLEGLNDEPSHFNYVKYIIDHHGFPVQTHTYKEPGAFVRNDYVYYHSPLYYLAGTPGYALLGLGGLYWCRVISFVCGIASLILLAKIFKKMGFSSDIQGAAVIFTGFFPCHAYFCSLTSNDSMSWAAALILTYLCLANGKCGDWPVFTLRRSLTIGVFLAIGFLIKVSILVFYPLVAMSFLYSWRRGKDNFILVKMLVAFGIACLLDGPWILRNYFLYHSITGIPLIVGPPVLSGSPLMIGKGIVGLLKCSIRFFWFPMQHIPPSIWQRPIGAVGAAIILFCLALCIRYFILNRRIKYNEVFLICLLLVNIISYIKVNRTWGNWEGRYLFPSLATIVFLMIVPLHHALASLRLNRLFFPVVILLGLWGYSYLLLTF